MRKRYNVTLYCIAKLIIIPPNLSSPNFKLCDKFHVLQMLGPCHSYIKYAKNGSLKTGSLQSR